MLFYHENGFYEQQEKKTEANNETILRKLFDPTELSHFSTESGNLANDDTSMLVEELSRKLNLNNVLPAMTVKYFLVFIIKKGTKY